jgi:hypothetical protein
MENTKEILITLNERYDKDFTSLSEALNYALTATENNAIGVSSADATNKMNSAKEIGISTCSIDAAAKAEKSVLESVAKAEKTANELVLKTLQDAKKYSDDLNVQTVNALTQSIKSAFAQFVIDTEKLILEKAWQLIQENNPLLVSEIKGYVDFELGEAVFKSESAGSVATAWAGANLEVFKKRVAVEVDICSKVDRVEFEGDVLRYESSNGQKLKVDVSSKNIVESFSRLKGEDLIKSIVDLKNTALNQLNVLQTSHLVNVNSANSGTIMM